MVEVYTKKMSEKKGRRAIDPRVVVSTLTLKYILKSTDEDIIELIKENLIYNIFLASRNIAAIIHTSRRLYLSVFVDVWEMGDLKSYGIVS